MYILTIHCITVLLLAVVVPLIEPLLRDHHPQVVVLFQDGRPDVRQRRVDVLWCIVILTDNKSLSCVIVRVNGYNGTYCTVS